MQDTNETKWPATMLERSGAGAEGSTLDTALPSGRAGPSQRDGRKSWCCKRSWGGVTVTARASKTGKSEERTEQMLTLAKQRSQR